MVSATVTVAWQLTVLPLLSVTASVTVLAPKLLQAKLVLLAEDEPEVRRVVRLQLAELGYPVLEVASGIEARQMLEQVGDITLLISDMVMPGGIGGSELAEIAAQLRPDLPVLLMTGYASATVTGDKTRLDIPVLRKPFDRQTLSAALEHLESKLENDT